MVLSLILGLATSHEDITVAVIHAYLDKGEEIYANIPRGFYKWKSLQVENITVWTAQSPRNFFRY